MARLDKYSLSFNMPWQYYKALNLIRHLKDEGKSRFQLTETHIVEILTEKAVGQYTSKPYPKIKLNNEQYPELCDLILDELDYLIK